MIYKNLVYYCAGGDDDEFPVEELADWSDATR